MADGSLDQNSSPITSKLLAWYRREKRRLPWRGTNDPYRIWVSEVMLQQTTVAAVHGRFAPFLARFPDLATLARAREESVVAAWSGLGYYSRARHLWRAARVIVSEHGGELPRDPGILRGLPGFGEYTAAAVASLAYGVPAPAADANVTRVLSRVHTIAGRAGTRRHRSRVLARARELLPRRQPGAVIAALMDLGQMICLPRRPRCSICPLQTECAAFQSKDPERYPALPGRPPVRRVHLAAAQARRNGRTLLVRRRPGGWLARMWEFPCAEGATPAAARRRLAEVLAGYGLRLETAEPLGRATHTIVRRRLEIEVFAAVPDAPEVPEAPEAAHGGEQERDGPGRWFSPRGLDLAAVSTLTRKIARACGFLPGSD